MKYIVLLLISLFSSTAAFAHQGSFDVHNTTQIGDRMLHFMTTFPHNIFWWIGFAVLTLALWKLIEMVYARFGHQK